MVISDDGIDIDVDIDVDVEGVMVVFFFVFPLLFKSRKYFFFSESQQISLFLDIYLSMYISILGS